MQLAITCSHHQIGQTVVSLGILLHLPVTVGNGLGDVIASLNFLPNVDHTLPLFCGLNFRLSYLGASHLYLL